MWTRAILSMGMASSKQTQVVSRDRLRSSCSQQVDYSVVTPSNHEVRICSERRNKEAAPHAHTPSSVLSSSTITLWRRGCVQRLHSSSSRTPSSLKFQYLGTLVIERGRNRHVQRTLRKSASSAKDQEPWPQYHCIWCAVQPLTSRCWPDVQAPSMVKEAW